MLTLAAVSKAIDEFDDAIRLDRTDAHAYSNRPLSYLRVGRYGEAEEDLKRAPAEAIEELRRHR